MRFANLFWYRKADADTLAFYFARIEDQIFGGEGFALTVNAPEIGIMSETILFFEHVHSPVWNRLNHPALWWLKWLQNPHVQMYAPDPGAVLRHFTHTSVCSWRLYIFLMRLKLFYLLLFFSSRHCVRLDYSFFFWSHALFYVFYFLADTFFSLYKHLPFSSNKPNSRQIIWSYSPPKIIAYQPVLVNSQSEFFRLFLEIFCTSIIPMTRTPPFYPQITCKKSPFTGCG